MESKLRQRWQASGLGLVSTGRDLWTGDLDVCRCGQNGGSTRCGASRWLADLGARKSRADIGGTQKADLGRLHGRLVSDLQS